MLLNLRPGARHGFQPLLTMIYWGNPLFHRQRKKLWETTVMDAPGLPDKRPAERWVIHRRIYKKWSFTKKGFILKTVRSAEAGC